MSFLLPIQLFKILADETRLGIVLLLSELGELCVCDLCTALDQSQPKIDQGMDAMMRATLDLGGTLAGEHGVGLLKMKYLPWEQSPPLLRIQRELKKVFDPDDLLNPGKILPPP